MRTLNPLLTGWSWPHRSFSSDLIGDVFDDFDRIINAVVRRKRSHAIGFQPSCDINEMKDHYFISFDMPGVKKEDIKIEIHGNQLVISGERRHEIKEEEGTFYHEGVDGRFERTFVLPTSIDADRIEAHYENGVLNVALPKAESAKERTIQIQSGKNSFFANLLGSKKEQIKKLNDLKAS